MLQFFCGWFSVIFLFIFDAWSDDFLLENISNKLNLDGRLMIDSGNVVKGKNNYLKDEISIRRSWLGSSGNINEDWVYRGLFGFENEDIHILDLFVNYKGIKNSEIVVGHFVENGGIDAYTVNLFSPLMERSDAFTTFRRLRRLGVSYGYFYDNFAAKIGIFGAGVGDNGKLVDQGESVSGKVYGLIFNDEEKYRNFHIGTNVSYRNPQSQNRGLRYKSPGNSHVIEVDVLDSDFLQEAHAYENYAVEARYQNGPFSVIGEYYKNIVNTKTNNLYFNSRYILLSYFLTGHKYKYNFQTGGINEILNQKGAIELVTRYSKVDLNYKNIRGGKLNSYDLGVNYYVNNNVKIMLNYIYNDLQYSSLSNDNVQYLMTRLQMWF
ncbi:MAG: hypothetical protein ISQ34_04340 [Rickettsiales bacterium]|nr:hypothetical protein [Rickettsiales bacterium]